MSATKENNTIYEVYEDNLKEPDKMIYAILNGYHRARTDSFTNKGGAVDGYSYIHSIKSTILSSLLESMPKERLSNTIDPALLHHVEEERFANGYNAALTDCIEVINKALGDTSHE